MVGGELGDNIGMKITTSIMDDLLSVLLFMALPLIYFYKYKSM